MQEKIKINFLIIISFSLFNLCFQEKILFSFQIFRHGARAPYSGLKNGVDVFKEKWSLEKDELSYVGKRQLYLLGVNVRKRYTEDFNLLKKEYNPQEILIRSTDSNRTLESVYSYLQGLFPSGSGPVIKEKVYNNKSIIFPPNEKYYEAFEKIVSEYNITNHEALPYQMSIEPIHIFYEPLHEFQLYKADICKPLLPYYEKLNEREEIKAYADDIIKDTNGLLLDLEPEAKNNSYFYDYWNLYKYTDNFVCDDTDVRNFSQMKNEFSYVNDTLIEKLRMKAKNFIEEDSILTYSSENISIVGASYTMHSIINWMEKAINNYKKGVKDNFIKFVVYSAHESSIGVIEGFMKYAFNTTIEYPTFADNRFFELYIDDKGQYKVRYLRADNSTKYDGDFEQFKNNVNDKSWSDENISDFCQFNTNKNEDNKDNKDKTEKDSPKNARLTLMIILGVLNAVLIAVLIIILILKKNKKI